MTDLLKCQCYYAGGGTYYFRVTKEQFDELKNDYRRADELSNQNRDKVTYSYGELFGE